MCHIRAKDRMPQLHLHVPDRIARLVRSRARARGLTVSQYVAELVRREVASAWPAGFFEDVVGGWSEAALRRPSQRRPERRDAL
jgi:hypothetical protein